ncbi:MAG: hypothetical protein JWL77_5560 [Chthonomonadaceae bacterium]|nr:hypothetical protein [Chthonomonadaceae bacterium]
MAVLVSTKTNLHQNRTVATVLQVRFLQRLHRFRIDRRALVARHKVKLNHADIMAPLSVGNGEFAFTADVTGLQTFEAEYGTGIPLSTMAQWGFHAAPNPQNFSIETFPLTTIDTSGRPVGYLYYENGKSPKAWEAAANYLYTNPSRFHLGRVALAMKRSDGHDAALTDLTDIHQELDLWTGCLDSRFTFDGHPVHVSTSCHPTQNQIAVRIESPLIATGQVAVRLAFPYGTAAFNGNGADWSRPNAHQTVLTRRNTHRADFARTLDADHYHAALEWAGKATLSEGEPQRASAKAKPLSRRC